MRGGGGGGGENKNVCVSKIHTEGLISEVVQSTYNTLGILY